MRDRRVSNMNMKTFNNNNDKASADEEPEIAFQVYHPVSVHGRG